MYVVTLPASAVERPHEFAERAASAGADVIEVRGDLTPDVPAFESSLPLLVAPRRTGGRLPARFDPEYLDLELGETVGPTGRAIVIRSYHDYRATPPFSELLGVAERCDREGADIIKVATAVHSCRDLAVLDEFHAALSPSRRRIILGMGMRVGWNRLLSPLRNEMTYSRLDDSESAAPGQLPLSLYRLIAHCRRPRLFAILGGPEMNSASPAIHNLLFARHGVDALFAPFPTADIEEAWSYLVRHELAGCAVTSPYKREILRFLDELDPLARELGSVNTVVREAGGYRGYNLDAAGISDGYRFFGAAGRQSQAIGEDRVLSSGDSVAILGSGGVVPAIIRACREAGVLDIRVFARNRPDREALAREFGIRAGELAEVNNVRPDLLVCAVNADAELPVPPAGEMARAIDLRYGPTTRFMTRAGEAGYRVDDGRPMLVCQALGQFRLFTGREPSSRDRRLLEELPGGFNVV